MSDCSQAVQRVASCPGSPRTLLHPALGKLVRCLPEALRPSGAALPAPPGHLYCQQLTRGPDLGLTGLLLNWGSRRGPGPRGEPSRPSASTSTGCRWLWGGVRHSALVREESLEGRSCAHPMGGPPTPRMIRESNPTWRRETTGTPSITSRGWDRLSLDTELRLLGPMARAQGWVPCGVREGRHWWRDWGLSVPNLVGRCP